MAGCSRQQGLPARRRAPVQWVPPHQAAGLVAQGRGAPVNQPDPQVFMGRFTSEQIAQKANKWGSRNTLRWSDAEYDALFKATQTEADPVERAAMFIRMNDILVSDGYAIPLTSRRRTLAAANKLVPALSAWDGNTGPSGPGTATPDSYCHP